MSETACWRMSADGERGVFADGAVGLRICCFLRDGKLFAHAAARSLEGSRAGGAWLGPFRHFAALDQAVSLVRRGLLGEAVSAPGVESVDPRDVEDVSGLPIPGFRLEAEPMHPGFAAAILRRLLVAVDAGEDVDLSVAEMEVAYEGPVVDGVDWSRRGDRDWVEVVESRAATRHDAPVGAVSREPPRLLGPGPGGVTVSELAGLAALPVRLVEDPRSRSQILIRVEKR